MLVDERPEQVPAPAIELPRGSEPVQVTAHVADQQSAARQRPWPVVEMRLEAAPTLASFDPPLPDPNLFLDRHDARHLEHEPSLGDGALQRVARFGIEVGGVPYERDLVVLRVPEREVTVGLGPRKALAEPNRDRHAV